MRRPFNNNDERRFEVRILRQQSREGADRELSADMAGTEVHDPNDGFTRRDRQRAEVAVMSEDDAPFADALANEGQVIHAPKTSLFHVENIMTLGTQVANYSGMNVLVGDEGEITKSQWAGSTARTTSFFRKRAA